MARYNVVDEENQEYESVAQFVVNLTWANSYYGSETPLPSGLNSVTIVVEGVATSTEAIEAAKTALQSVRCDEPRETKVELKTSRRRLPKQIGPGVSPR
jgi:hypothetical protein